MKQQNKYKEWKHRTYRGEQRGKRKVKKIDDCYRCGYAGLKFDIKKLCFRPYCFYKAHNGILYGINIEKWNVNLRFREEKYMEYINNKKRG